MQQTLVIGSTCADVVITVKQLPKTAEDVHILAQTIGAGRLCVQCGQYPAADAGAGHLHHARRRRIVR